MDGLGEAGSMGRLDVAAAALSSELFGGISNQLQAEMAEPVPRTGSKVPYLEPVTKLEPWFHIFGTMVPQH